MTNIELSVFVKQDKEKVYALIKNMELFPEFMENVQKIKVIERTKNKIITEWKTDIDGTPLEWTEEDIFDDAKASCKFEALDGDYKYKGLWKLEDMKDGRARLSISAAFDWELPVFEKFVGHILKRKAKKSLKSMLMALKNKAEGKA